MRVLGLVGCSADGVERLREGMVEPALARGWRVAVTLTPTAAGWLRPTGEIARIEALTGLSVRSVPRLPGEPRPHPDPDCFAVVPATANTVAKLALGLADNQALTVLCEALGGGAVPIVVCPRANAAHAGHPAWAGHLATLRAAGVRLVEPEPEPWTAVLRAVEHAFSQARRRD